MLLQKAFLIENFSCIFSFLNKDRITSRAKEVKRMNVSKIYFWRLRDVWTMWLTGKKRIIRIMNNHFFIWSFFSSHQLLYLTQLWNNKKSHFLRPGKGPGGYPICQGFSDKRQQEFIFFYFCRPATWKCPESSGSPIITHFISPPLATLLHHTS